jgi:hypothetical protein
MSSEVDSRAMSRITQQRLIELYAERHKKGDRFHGKSLGPHLEELGKLIQETGSKTILDYGCGRACFYRNDRVHEKWGVVATLYEPGIDELSSKPEGKFDGVICTDVLEHILEPEKVLPEIIGYAEKFCFLSISCRPSALGKVLSDGTPFHVSVHPPTWWRERIPKTDVRIEVRFDVPE